MAASCTEAGSGTPDGSSTAATTTAEPASSGPTSGEATTAATSVPTTAPEGTSGDDSSPGSAVTSGDASSGDATSGDATSGDASTGDASTGAEQPEYVVVYETLCASCHGLDAAGVNQLGPEIRHVHPLMAAYMVRNGDSNMTLNKNNMLVGHPGTMPGFSTADVSDAVLDDIVAWLQTFPQEVDGQALFADHCSFCHGLKGGTDVEYASAFHNMPFMNAGSDTLPEFIARVRSGHIIDDMQQPVLPSKRRAYMPPFTPEMVSDEQLALMEAWARKQ